MTSLSGEHKYRRMEKGICYYPKQRKDYLAGDGIYFYSTSFICLTDVKLEGPKKIPGHIN